MQENELDLKKVADQLTQKKRTPQVGKGSLSKVVENVLAAAY